MKHKYIISAAATLVIALIGFLVLRGVDKPAAVVNGIPISEAELQRVLESRAIVHQGTGASVSSDALRSSVLEQLISETLILEGAREAGVEVSDDEINAELTRIKGRGGEDAFRDYLKENSLTEQEYAERLRDGLMKKRFVDDMLFNEDVPEEDIREYYKESPMPFMTSETVEIRIVEMETQEAADAAMEEMRSIKQDGFDKVADRLKDDNTAFVSEYGETNPDFYPGEVGKAMKELPEGQYGGPYKGKEGFFIIRIKKRIPERPRTYEEAREEIEALLRERMRSAAISHWVAEKRNNSTIVRD